MNRTKEAIRTLIAEDYDLIARDGSFLDTARFYDDAIFNELPASCNTVIDAGCGTGEFSPRLASRAAQVKAIDISPESIRIAKQRYGETGVEFCVAAIEDLPTIVKPGSCNVIIANRVIHHCHDLHHLIENLLCLLEPGGKLIILDLDSTGGGAPRWRRCALMILYKLTVTLKGAMKLNLFRTLSELYLERQVYASRGWKQHLSHEPDFSWYHIKDAIMKTGAQFTCRRLNWRFVLFIVYNEKPSEGAAMSPGTLYNKYDDERNAVVVRDISECKGYIDKHFEKDDGEIWLFNSDLEAFINPAFFKSLYVDTIAQKSTIKMVRLVLTRDMVYKVIDQYPDSKNKWATIAKHFKDSNAREVLLPKTVYCYLDDLPQSLYTHRISYREFVHYVSDEGFIFYTRGNSITNQEIVCIHRRLADLDKRSKRNPDLRIIITANIEGKPRFNGFSKFMTEEILDSFKNIFLDTENKWKPIDHLIEQKLSLDRPSPMTYLFCSGNLEQCAKFVRDLNDKKKAAEERDQMCVFVSGSDLSDEIEMAKRLELYAGKAKGPQELKKMLLSRFFKLEWIEQLLERREIGWNDIEKDEELNLLLDDPRFQRIKRKYDTKMLTNKQVAPIRAEDIRDKIHYAILTIKPEEHEAVFSRFDQSVTVRGARRDYELTQFETKSNKKVNVVLTRNIEPGPGGGQDAAEDIFDDFDFEWMFIVGIGGGVADHEYSLGDVMLASRLVDFSVCEVGEKGIKYEPASTSMHPDVERLLGGLNARYLKGDLAKWNTKESIHCLPPRLHIPASIDSESLYGDSGYKKKVLESLRRNFPDNEIRDPKFRDAPQGSSGDLIKDVNFLKQRLNVAKSLASVEMELAGVCRGIRRREVNYGQRPLLAIRGLSDIVGFIRDHDWTLYACHTAASFAIALIKSGIVDPMLVFDDNREVDRYFS